MASTVNQYTKYNIDSFSQSDFDNAQLMFKAASVDHYIFDVDFTNVFVIAVSNPKYWDEFSRYFSENSVPQTFEVNGKQRSIACNLNFVMSHLEVDRRKTFFDNITNHLEQLGFDLNGPCDSGTVYENLQESMYKNTSGSKIYTESDLMNGTPKKQFSEDEMLIRAIDSKDGCHYSYNDEEKPMSEWSGNPTFAGLRDCGKCNKVVDRKEKMKIFWAAQKTYFDKLKTSGSKTIGMIKTLPDLLKLDPDCQSYIMIYNFLGEDAARQRLRPLLPISTSKIKPQNRAN
jgi:hypothetical protein